MTRAALCCAVAGVVLATGAGPALAKVYTCIDPKTREVTLSQTECPDTRSPSMAETAAGVEAARVARIEADALESAKRADRQLLKRFPDEASHRKAEAAELDGVLRNIRLTMRRWDELAAKRKPLDIEAAFHATGTMPAALRRAIGESDGSFNGLADAFHGQERSVADIVARFRAERERLRRLWAGAAAGSMGPLDAASVPARAK